MKERHRMLGASHLILRKENQVLLIRRCHTGYHDGDYGLPSGHLEPGESFLQAAIREAQEEVGVTLHSDDVEFVHIGHRWSSDYVNLFFAASIWSGEVRNAEPEKCDDVRWFSMDALPSNIVPYVAKALMDVQESRMYREE